jgi:peptide/nickel transport system substrate-binding protein
MTSTSRSAKRLAALSIITASALALVGCSASAATTGASTASKPVSGGILRFATLDAPQVLDPHGASSYPESIIADNITDKLTYQDPKTGKITPWLATSWTASTDLKQFTFHLRKGVTFSDGTPFDAKAVKDNLDQLALGDAKLGIDPGGSKWASYVTTTVDDADTVTVKFSKSYAGFLQLTSFTGDDAPGFISESTLAKTKQERTDPKNVIGTGPFVLSSFTYQADTVLKRRAGYAWAPPALHHSGAAYLKEIDFKVIPEATVRTGALQSGTIDASLDIQPTDEKVLAKSGYQILARPISGRDIAFDFNTRLGATSDLAVRRAIQLGWSRSALKKSVLTDSYPVSTSALASTVPGYESFADSALKFDQKKAKALLDADGWKVASDGIREKDGKPLTLKLLGIDNLVVNSPAFELIQQDLREIGIDLKLSVLPIPDFSAQYTDAAKNYNIVVVNTSQDDPVVLDNIYNPTLNNSANVDPSSAEGKDLTTTLDKINSTLDPTDRAAATKAGQELVVGKYALTSPVYTPTQVIAANKDVHGILFDAQSRNLFVDTYLTK